VEFTQFVRKPFPVEAVKITKENIAEVADLIGTLCNENTDAPYIKVDRHKVPSIFKVTPGFWMTKMGDNIRCYSKRIFEKQFLEATPEIQGVLDLLSDDDEEVDANG